MICLRTWFLIGVAFTNSSRLSVRLLSTTTLSKSTKKNRMTRKKLYENNFSWEKEVTFSYISTSSSRSSSLSKSSTSSFDTNITDPVPCWAGALGVLVVMAFMYGKTTSFLAFNSSFVIDKLKVDCGFLEL